MTKQLTGCVVGSAAARMSGCELELLDGVVSTLVAGDPLPQQLRATVEARFALLAVRLGGLRARRGPPVNLPR